MKVKAIGQTTYRRTTCSPGDDAELRKRRDQGSEREEKGMVKLLDKLFRRNETEGLPEEIKAHIRQEENLNFKHI